jgi:hypothetical protein
MRWILMCCLVAGCAAGADMRPRGKRNSLRIETLEKKMEELQIEMRRQLAENRRLLALIAEKVEQLPAPQPAPDPAPAPTTP